MIFKLSIYRNNVFTIEFERLSVSTLQKLNVVKSVAHRTIAVNITRMCRRAGTSVCAAVVAVDAVRVWRARSVLMIVALAVRPPYSSPTPLPARARARAHTHTQRERET